MADTEPASMRNQVILRTSMYAIAFTCLTAFFIFEVDDKFITGQLSLKDLLQIQYLPFRIYYFILSTIFTIILTALYDLRMQTFLDSVFYKLSAQVRGVIEAELISSSEKVGINQADDIRGKTDKIFDTFYHFANQQEVLRGLAFNYWTTYYANIKTIAVGFVSLLTMFSYLVVSANFERLLISPISALIIIAALHLYTGGCLSKKILNLPKKQFSDIVATHRNELKAQILNRFFT